ncbi:hypothetical protein L5515_019268 [Caenorhabditis briggsae]|uniref:C2H2-type domain-containing protein n=2 Tax=Caenorhabditis briggsae TaxID=6238 RepID=A0AAE9JV92_CAEBR|nr:hypothetical protein L5515_019268 [Caenorhabditis briggsae]
MFSSDVHRPHLYKISPNMTLNEYNATPSPPFTPPCYAPMTPVSFGSMYSNPDTPSSDLLSLSPNKSAEYRWLTANGSMNPPKVLLDTSTSRSYSSVFDDSGSSRSSSDVLSDYSDMYSRELMDYSTPTGIKIGAAPIFSHVLQQQQPVLAPLLSSTGEEHLNLINLAEKCKNNSTNGNGISIKQKLEQSIRERSMMKNDLLNIVKHPPILSPLPEDIMEINETPRVAKKSKKKKSRPRLSASGKPIGRPLGSFKVPQAEPSVKRRTSYVDDGVHNICLWKGCATEFTSSDLFYDHVKTHMAEYGHRLRVCHWDDCIREQRPFDAFYKVQVHIRTHTKETPFHCKAPGCLKSYKRLENLRAHALTHRELEHFTCSVCQKLFADREDCENHEKKQHASKNSRNPYLCLSSQCVKRYADPSALKKHLKNNHPQLLPAYEAREYRQHLP